MSKFCQLKIKIGNIDEIFPFFAYNENTTFDDLLEFIAYNYPQLNICPCFKFKGQYVNNNEFIDIDNNWKFASCINKFYIYKIEINKECRCSQEFKEYYRQSKKYIINDIKQKNNHNLNNIKIDYISGNIIAKENLNKKVNFTDFYDLIINIKSIKDISKGWKIQMNERGREQYEKYRKNKEIIKIGVIGNSNKGKSFLLSKISKIDIPSGTSIRTKGLSIKYPKLDEKYKHRNFVLLDSAGLETPVIKKNKHKNNNKENNENNKDNENNKNKENNENKENKEINEKHNNEDNYNLFKENDIENENEDENEDENEMDNEKEIFREKSREKLITELFLQNYIIYNSDILIIVVGILTYSEQKLLNKIKSEIQRAKIGKSLFVIHNLITYTSIEQVNEYIEKYLLKSVSFNLEKRTEITTDTGDNKKIYFYEKNSKQKIYHLIFANEGSEAGMFFNKFTLNFLENEFQRVTDLKPFDAIKTVKERFIEMSNEILEIMDAPLTMKDFDISENEIKLNKSKKVVLKKCLIDELGFSNLKTNGFEPVYNCYKKDDKIIVKVEGPGNCSINSEIIYSGEYTIIRLKGNKKKDKEPAKIEENLYNSRILGKFTLDIPLKTSDYILKNEQPVIEEKKGVLILQFNLDKHIEYKGYNVDENEEI